MPTYGIVELGPFWSSNGSKMAYLRVQLGDIRVQNTCQLTKVGPTWATPTYSLKYAPYINKPTHDSRFNQPNHMALLEG